MGFGYWTRDSFETYSSSRGRRVTASGELDKNLTDHQIYTQRQLHPRLNPCHVMRECCDSKDHPETIPVILGLDVTGSMGPASAEVAKKMNLVMTKLYDQIRDVEFMIMGIGDLAYDRAPIQISQFESDIRIAEQLDLVYMEHGGGSNSFESYTAAWYMGVCHTRLDCWRRGKKGLIITMGDENLNPYLPKDPLNAATGDHVQADVETPQLYREAAQKYEIYHIFVRHRKQDPFWPSAQNTFEQVLAPQHMMAASVDEIADTLVKIITDFACKDSAAPDRISWDTGKASSGSTPGGHREKAGFDRLISW